MVQPLFPSVKPGTGSRLLACWVPPCLHPCGLELFPPLGSFLTLMYTFTVNSIKVYCVPAIFSFLHFQPFQLPFKVGLTIPIFEPQKLSPGEFYISGPQNRCLNQDSNSCLTPCLFFSAMPFLLTAPGKCPFVLTLLVFKRKPARLVVEVCQIQCV